MDDEMLSLVKAGQGRIKFLEKIIVDYSEDSKQYHKACELLMDVAESIQSRG